ncbi:MAG: hypothetical protein M1833_006513 [Piccolia ochrophora]|nr:MAG: hypothetical protein M1833_006513 [Piccolia ochrophora]
MAAHGHGNPLPPPPPPMGGMPGRPMGPAMQGPGLQGLQQQLQAMNMNMTGAPKPAKPMNSDSEIVDIREKKNKPNDKGGNLQLEGYKLRRADALEGERMTWARVERRLMSISVDELAKEIKQFNKNGTSVYKAWEKLSPNQQKQVDSIIDRKMKEERDPAHEWVFVYIKAEKKMRRGSWNSSETVAVNVILKRQEKTNAKANAKPELGAKNMPVQIHDMQGPKPQQSGPQQMGPQQMGPQQMGPQQMGPQPMGPQQMGPQQMGPKMQTHQGGPGQPLFFDMPHAQGPPPPQVKHGYHARANNEPVVVVPAGPAGHQRKEYQKVAPPPPHNLLPMHHGPPGFGGQGPPPPPQHPVGPPGHQMHPHPFHQGGQAHPPMAGPGHQNMKGPEQVRGTMPPGMGFPHSQPQPVGTSPPRGMGGPVHHAMGHHPPGNKHPSRKGSGGFSGTKMPKVEDWLKGNRPEAFDYSSDSESSSDEFLTETESDETPLTPVSGTPPLQYRKPQQIQNGPMNVKPSANRRSQVYETTYREHRRPSSGLSRRYSHGEDSIPEVTLRGAHPGHHHHGSFGHRPSPSMHPRASPPMPRAPPPRVIAYGPPGASPPRSMFEWHDENAASEVEFEIPRHSRRPQDQPHRRASVAMGYMPGPAFAPRYGYPY